MSVSLSIVAGAAWQFFNDDGIPLSGGLVYTYDAGTTTPRTTYTDSAGLIANSNPIVLDASGRTPAEVWLTDGVLYKFVVRTSAGVLIGTYDNLYGVSDATAANILYTPAGVGAITRSVQDKLRDYVSLGDYDTLKNALAIGKRVQISPSTTSINITTADSPSILPFLHLIDAESDLTLNLEAGAHTTTSGNIAVVGQNENITLVGAAPLETSLSSVVSVSGTAGDYTVVLDVANASGIAPGHFLKIDNAVPMMTFSGDNSVFRDRVAQNELGNQLANLSGVTGTTGGGSITWSAVFDGSLSDYVSTGDLITVKGQTRVVDVVSVTSATLTANWDLGFTATRAWYISRPNSGTVGTGGSSLTTVTGSSSLFTSEANVGDMLLADGKMVLITAIGGDTTLTVSPAVTLSNGSPYSIITPAVAHEGTHEVLSISGTQVTVRNRWRGLYPPPVRRISGGEVRVIRTVLKNTGTGDGLIFQQNSALKFLNNLVLQGNNSNSGSHGIALNGRTAEGPTQIGPVGMVNAGNGFSAVSWGRGAFVGNGCVLQTRRSHYSGNLDFGVWVLEGATANLREVVVSGTNGRGVQINSNSTLLFTEGHSVGNASDGLSSEAGTSIYAEIPCFWSNGSMGMRFTGGTGFHVNEGVTGSNGASGVFSSAGASGEMARMLSCGNARENFEFIENAQIYAAEIWSTGARGTVGSGYGIFAAESAVVANGCALINNAGGPGYFSGTTAVLDAPASYIKGTQNDGLNILSMAKSRLSSGIVEELNVTLGATVYVDGVSPAPTLNGVARLNEISARGAVVKNDSSTDGVGVSALRINGGDVANRMLTKLVSINFGTVNAHTTASATETVTGSETDDVVMVGISNQGSIPDGVVFVAAVTAADTVTVKCINTTAGNIAVNAQSLRLVVLGFA